MKIFIRNTLIISAIGLFGYYLYKYITDEYAPKSKREYYSARYLKKKEMKLVQRRLMHEEIESELDNDNYYKDASTREASQRLSGTNIQLKELITSLEQKNLECESYIRRVLPNEQIIDPENNFFSDPSVVFGKANDVFSFLFPRRLSMEALNQFEDYFMSKDEVNLDFFYNTIRSAMICRKGDVGLFLESIFESMESGNWSPSEVIEFNGYILGAIKVSIEDDFLPDNLLFSLNLLRLVGTREKFPEEFFNELDEVYQRIADYEDSFFDGSENSKKIYNPGGQLESYLDELELISDDIRYIMLRRFSNYALE